MYHDNSLPVVQGDLDLSSVDGVYSMSVIGMAVKCESACSKGVH